MSQWRFAVWAVGVGIAVPVLWLVVQRVFLSNDPDLSYLLLSSYRFDRVLLALWPSSVLLMADPEGKSTAIPTVAIAANAVLYGAVGWLVRFGLNRRGFMLPVVGIGVVAGWYFLLSWYAGG
jgi:hypothetical protein